MNACRFSVPSTSDVSIRTARRKTSDLLIVEGAPGPRGRRQVDMSEDAAATSVVKRDTLKRMGPYPPRSEAVVYVCRQELGGAVDTGRRWALEVFGQYGPRLRDQIADMVVKEHEASLDAQEASGHRSQSVYGEFWRGILERFEAFGELPGATLVRPGDAPYKLPVVNGVVLFPWRYAKGRDAQLETTRFGTSETRYAMTRLRQRPVQDALVEVDDLGLSEEEQALLSELESVSSDPVVGGARLVLVAIAASSRGLFGIDWGSVRLDHAGHLDWDGFHENLLPLGRTALAVASTAGSFTAGTVPARFPATEQAPTGSADDD